MNVQFNEVINNNSYFLITKNKIYSLIKFIFKNTYFSLKSLDTLDVWLTSNKV